MAMDAANLARETLVDTRHAVKYGSDPSFEMGFEMGVRASLRRVLAARKIVLTQEQEHRIESCSDLPTLELWLESAVVALSASEALQ